MCSFSQKHYVGDDGLNHVEVTFADNAIRVREKEWDSSPDNFNAKGQKMKSFNVFVKQTKNEFCSKAEGELTLGKAYMNAAFQVPWCAPGNLIETSRILELWKETYPNSFSPNAKRNSPYTPPPSKKLKGSLKGSSSTNEKSVSKKKDDKKDKNTKKKSKKVATPEASEDEAPKEEDEEDEQTEVVDEGKEEEDEEEEESRASKPVKKAKKSN